MIKRLLALCLVLLALAPALPMRGQTPFWSEDFMDPQGWTLEGNWYMGPGYMWFSWDPIVVNYDMSAYSPVISLEDRDYGMSIIQYLEPWTMSATTEKAEISLLAGGDEYLLWSYDLANGPWGAVTGSEVDFDISAYAGMDIQLRFRSYGPTTDAWFWWEVFSISIITFLDNDMAITSINGPVTLEKNQTGNWHVGLKNMGLEYQKNFSVNLFEYKTGNMVGSFLEMDSLGFGQTKSYSFQWESDSAYNTVMVATLEHEGDEYEANNTSPGAFLRVKPNRDLNILVWENDNGIPTIVDPEQGDVVRPGEGFRRAMDAAGFEYEAVYALPDEVQDYDVILGIMGCYCVT